jgi:VanZ family protein
LQSAIEADANMQDAIQSLNLHFFSFCEAKITFANRNPRSPALCPNAKSITNQYYTARAAIGAIRETSSPKVEFTRFTRFTMSFSTETAGSARLQNNETWRLLVATARQEFMQWRERHITNALTDIFSLQNCQKTAVSLLFRSLGLLQRNSHYALWLSLSTIVVLSLLPGQHRPHTGAPGQVEHFIAYLGAGLFVAVRHQALRSRLVLWVGVASLSCLLELLQQFVPGRVPNPFDALASSSGLVAGLLLGILFIALVRHLREIATVPTDAFGH